MVKNYSWELNEQEKKRIIELHESATKSHYILKEAENQQREESLVVNLDARWGDGKYVLTKPQVDILSSRLQQMSEFVTKHKDGSVSIQIEASESQVTNYDREVNPPKKVAPGVLAKNRADNIVNYLKKYFESVNLTNVVFPEPIVKVGQTPYTKPEDKTTNAAKYAAERYVRAIITLKKQYDCLVGLQITIGYYKGKNKAGHLCDEAIFEVKLNGVSLGEVNLNNDTKDAFWKSDYSPKGKEYGAVWNQFNSLGRYTDNEAGGTRYQSFTLDDSKAKQIMDSSKQNTLTLSLLPLVGQNTKYKMFYKYGSHSETPWVTIKNQSGVLYDAEPNLTLKRGSMSETTILTLDKCGNPLQQQKTTT